LNPVRTTAALRLPAEERLQRLERYRWSSYRAYAGHDKVPGWLTCGPVLAFCGHKLVEQRREYRRFVESAMGETAQEDENLVKSSALAVGGESFVDWIRTRLLDGGRRRKSPQDDCLRALSVYLPAERVLEVTAHALGVRPEAFRQRRRSSDLRGIAIRMLCRYAGLTQRAAAVALGMGSGAAAGRQMKRIEERARNDRRRHRLVASIESALESEAGH